MRLLIVGGSGFLGGELARRCSAAGHEVVATYLTRPGKIVDVEWAPLDVLRRDDVDALVGAHKPEMVVNAAYRQADWTTTAAGAANVALAASAAGARLVHMSSDAVLSGATTSYDEISAHDPITPYDAARTSAETAVNGVTARTSLLTGDGDSPHEALAHFPDTGRGRGVLFTDDLRSPVHVADLAAALLELAASGHHGVHHVFGADAVDAVDAIDTADAVSRNEPGLLTTRRDGLDEDRLPSGRRADTDVPGPMGMNCC